MPFQKGKSGNPAGRKKGIPDKVSAEVRQLARGLFDGSYWKRTKDQLAKGELAPQIHAKLLAYAYGEPVSEHNGKGSGITVNIGFLSNGEPTVVSVQELTRRAPVSLPEGDLGSAPG